jgi:hypothetical protein
MADNETTPQDPIAPFVNGGQAQTQEDKYTFAGQEWPSKQACEEAYAKSWSELQARANAAVQQQPTQQSTVTGRESVGYQYDKAQFSKEYLTTLADDPIEAQRKSLNILLFGTPTPPAGLDAVSAIRANITSGLRSSAELDTIKLRAEHPEINFTHPNTLKTLGEIRTHYGLADNFAGNEAAIALGQTRGALPTRQHMEAFVREQQARNQPQQPQRNPFELPETTGWQVYGSTGDIPDNVTPMRPPVGPPAMGRHGVTAPSLDVRAVMEKMDDPGTTLEQTKKLRDGLQEFLQKNVNPTAVGY